MSAAPVAPVAPVATIEEVREALNASGLFEDLEAPEPYEDTTGASGERIWQVARIATWRGALRPPSTMWAQPERGGIAQVWFGGRWWRRTPFGLADAGRFES